MRDIEYLMSLEYARHVQSKTCRDFTPDMVAFPLCVNEKCRKYDICCLSSPDPSREGLDNG